MKEKLIELINQALKANNITDNAEIQIETPSNKENGDYASNIAMKLAGYLHQSPMTIANLLLPYLK